MTGREIVTASLRLLGVLAPGENLGASEATDGLSALNRMLGSWSNESLLINAKVRDELTLTPNDQQYSMGTGADFNTARPIRIEEALIRDESSSPAIEIPVKLLTKEEWAAIQVKESTSTYPHSLYAEGTYPNETINLYPKPTAAHKLVLYSWKPLPEIATLDTSVSLPPGYDDALIYNLAIRLAPEYGRAVSDAVGITATEAKAAIKRINHKPRYLKVDDALSPRGGGFNIYTGGSR